MAVDGVGPVNTPAHLILGAAAFSSPNRKRSFWAAILGALAPDVSLYLMASVSIFVMGISPGVVFRDYYYSDAWQSVFAVDNSFVLWGVIWVVVFLLRRPLALVFASAALLHLALDFPFHTHDARQHFWPISNWVFESSISYWDRHAHAGIVGTFEVALSVALSIFLLARFRSWIVRGIVVMLLGAELFSSSVWQFL